MAYFFTTADLSATVLLLLTKAQKLILTFTYSCFRSSILQWSIILVLSSADHFYLIPPFLFSPPPLTLLLRRCRYVSLSVWYFKDLKQDFCRSHEMIFSTLCFDKRAYKGFIPLRTDKMVHMFQALSPTVCFKRFARFKCGWYYDCLWLQRNLDSICIQYGKTELLNKHGCDFNELCGRKFKHILLTISHYQSAQGILLLSYIKHSTPHPMCFTQAVGWESLLINTTW